jgi:hypothetical protein
MKVDTRSENIQEHVFQDEDALPLDRAQRVQR